MDIQILPMVKEYLSKNNILISDNTNIESLVHIMAKHFDALLYNIASLAALVASIENQTTIQHKHLVAAQAYIAHKCIGRSASKRIIGGSKKISIEELNSIDLPPISETVLDGGYRRCSDTDLKDFVHQILDHHNISIDKNALKGILNILTEHLECMLYDIKRQEPITVAKFEKIMAMRRYAVFN